jgi:hypothetical protein
MLYCLQIIRNREINMLEFQWTVLNHGVSADIMNAPESNSISALSSSFLVLVQYLINHYACWYFSNPHILAVYSFL